MGKSSRPGGFARRIVVASWLMFAACMCRNAAATTPGSVELALSETEQEILLQLACQGPAQSLSVRRQVDLPLYDYAEIQCESRDQYRGHPVAKFVECRRSADSAWVCLGAVPTIEIRTADGRTIHIRHGDVTSQEALDIATFLLGEPKYRNVTVQPEWIVDGTRIYRTDAGLLVSAAPYYFTLATNVDSEGPRFRINGISVCELDVCHRLHIAESR